MISSVGLQSRTGCRVEIEHLIQRGLIGEALKCGITARIGELPVPSRLGANHLKQIMHNRLLSVRWQALQFFQGFV